jgi:hypothetical protein
MAMRVTDATWLQLHPATALWHQQREKCRACAHHLLSVERARDQGGERCGALRIRIGGRGGGRHVHPYCPDARADGGECGPGAAKFTPKKGKR